MTLVPVPASTTSAMAILEKYAALNRFMDEARQETLDIHDRMDDTKTQIEDLIHLVRDNMNHEMQQAQLDKQRLCQECQVARANHKSLKDDPPKSSLYDTLPRMIREHRLEFIDQSKQFRRTLQRLRLTASDLGLDMAASQSWLEINGLSVEEEVYGNEQAEDDQDDVATELLEAEWHQEAVGRLVEDSKSHGTHNKNDDDDVEMEQALEAYQHSWIKRATTAITFQTMDLEHEKAQERRRGRHTRQDQLRVQLERICRDTATLEERLLELQHDTRMVKGMEVGFRQRIEQDGARRPKNPYSSTHAPAPTTTIRPDPISDDRQHPHLVQRHRRYADRQFQTSVGVVVDRARGVDDSDDEVGADDDILSFTPFRK